MTHSVRELFLTQIFIGTMPPNRARGRRVPSSRESS